MFEICEGRLYEVCLVLNFTSLVLELFVTYRLFVKGENYISQSHLKVISYSYIPFYMETTLKTACFQQTTSTQSRTALH